MRTAPLTTVASPMANRAVQKAGADTTPSMPRVQAGAASQSHGGLCQQHGTNDRNGSHDVEPPQTERARNTAGRIEVLAWGSSNILTRPCVDCGRRTGRFCDWCYAADRLPLERWAAGQHTPLCSHCDNRYDKCHFCRLEDGLVRTCVDCGLITGHCCGLCLATTRLPDESWAPGQHTPLCSQCDRLHAACHFCRGAMWATPPTV